jgi:hypothetical protein
MKDARAFGHDGIPGIDHPAIHVRDFVERPGAHVYDARMPEMGVSGKTVRRKD